MCICRSGASPRLMGQWFSCSFSKCLWRVSSRPGTRRGKGEAVGQPAPCSSVVPSFVQGPGHEDTMVKWRAEQIRVPVLTRGTQEGFSEEVTTKTWSQAVRGRGQDHWPQVPHLAHGRMGPQTGVNVRARVGSPPSPHTPVGTLLSDPAPRSEKEKYQTLLPPAWAAAPHSTAKPSISKQLQTFDDCPGPRSHRSCQQNPRPGNRFPTTGDCGTVSSYSWFFLSFLFIFPFFSK